MVVLKILILFLAIWIIIRVIWYYSPASLLNVKHNITSELTIDKLKEPVLILVTHNDVANDLIFICGEARKSKHKLNIMAVKIKFSLRKILQGLPLFTSYNRLLVEDSKSNKKTNTVEKGVKLIKNNQSIVIFLNKGNKRTGFYNILKQTKIPIVFCRMKGENCDLNKENKELIFGRKINIEYELYDNYDLKMEKEQFIEHINNKLYKVID